MDTPHPNPPPVPSKRRRNLEPSVTAKTRCNFLSPYKPMFLSCMHDLHMCVIVSHSLTVCAYSCLLGGFFMVLHCKIWWYFSLPSSTNIDTLTAIVKIRWIVFSVLIMLEPRKELNLMFICKEDTLTWPIWKTHRTTRPNAGQIIVMQAYRTCAFVYRDVIHVDVAKMIC